MEKICPVCNGLMNHGPICRCGAEMIDTGLVSDYFGPYSPYFSECFKMPHCLHLFTCPHCHEDLRLAVKMEEVDGK